MVIESIENIYIYGLADPISGMIRYVGKSTVPERRYEEHIVDRRHSYKSHWIHSLLQQNLKPLCVILETLEANDGWQRREKYWIAYGHEQGWPLTNLTDGGDGVCGRTGWRHTEETKRKIGDANRGRKLPPISEETRQRLSKAGMGRDVSKETRQRISKTLIGHSVSEEARCKISKANTGRVFSEEYKRRMSEILTGRVFSEEHRCNISEAAKNRPPMSKETKQKIREANLGKKHSDETRRKMSEARRGEDGHNAKLTSREVLEIRQLYKTTQISRKELAQRFSIPLGTLDDVIYFKTWKHLRR